MKEEGDSQIEIPSDQEEKQEKIDSELDKSNLSETTKQAGGPTEAEQYVEVPNTAVTSTGDGDESTKVDVKPNDKPPSKWRGILKKVIILGIVIAGCILYIMDHSIQIEKQGDECPIYSHRVYGEDCTLKKFSRLEEDEEPDTECQ